MQIAITLLAVLAVVIVIGGLVALGAARLQRQRARDVHGTPTDTLRFPVPEGQDIVVSCRSTRDRDRERIRAIVGGTPSSLEGGTTNGPGIRFRDEGGRMHGA